MFDISVSIGFLQLIRYFNNVDKLYSSIFEIEDKSVVGYFTEMLFKELLLNVLEVVGSITLLLILIGGIGLLFLTSNKNTANSFIPVSISDGEQF